MKTKEFRDNGTEDLKRAHKLNPIKKSGKERHQLYNSNDDDMDDLDDYAPKRESILDYFEEED